MKYAMIIRAMQRRLARNATAALFLGAMLAAAPAAAQITDAGVYPPPTSGAYGYNSFTPGSAGFPGVGGTYTDPVFGSVVRRLTNIQGKANQDDIYAHHWINANGTLAFHKDNSGVHILDVSNGRKVYSGQPSGLNHSENFWDALDPDKYYYFSGSNLVRRNLASQTNTTMKTFPSRLEKNGGSLNIQSRDGRYFTVRYGGTNKVWDSLTDTIYAGSVTPLDSGGWVSITPDGNYIVTAAGRSAQPNKEHYSYRINHSTKLFNAFRRRFILFTIWD